MDETCDAEGSVVVLTSIHTYCGRCSVSGRRQGRDLKYSASGLNGSPSFSDS
jgi:hypothetical protein